MALTAVFHNAFALPNNVTGSPIVTLNHVQYTGLHNATLHTNTYFSIPFAAPPVGPLRWKAPQPYVQSTNLTPNKTIVDATKRGPSCVQATPYPFWTEAPAPIPAGEGSENCLTLNVYTPDTATPTSNLPVMFNIHGGGYVVGAAGNEAPYAMLRHSKNAFIYVSIQYRLGAYGFLGGPKYASMGGAPNLGLQDQRLALKWTQENIAAFGGDPSKVTIMGGSAGGGSVTAQMMWSGGEEKPPFRAALADYPFWQQFIREDQLDKQFDALLEAAGCREKTLECLQEIPEDKLKNATQDTYTTAYFDGAYGYGHFYYGPYVDGEFLRGFPSEEFNAGRFAHVPTLVSRNGYEGFVFTNMSASFTPEDEKADLRKHFPYANQAVFDKLYEIYPNEAFNSTFWHRQTWFGDFSINCPTYTLASSLTKANTPVYKVVFNAGSQLHGAIGEFIGDLDYASRPGANVTIADTIKDYYVSFMLYLNPNAKSWSNLTKPVWREYAESKGEVMSFNYTAIGNVEDQWYDDTERCRFWEENGDVVGV
ncbi:alpha/beta-hydrolase [Periconia macrospinosa]|uniref:Carboxylic ester hydrolase n=1 Tax=Periconia macrospinosa TaxID=97972 RepID=A0A2V1E106_9PLEO|nr:alpha/beta-hydrolase [Periconia macrospinosa]